MTYTVRTTCLNTLYVRLVQLGNKAVWNCPFAHFSPNVNGVYKHKTVPESWISYLCEWTAYTASDLVWQLTCISHWSESSRVGPVDTRPLVLSEWNYPTTISILITLRALTFSSSQRGYLRVSQPGYHSKTIANAKAWWQQCCCLVISTKGWRLEAAAAGERPRIALAEYYSWLTILGNVHSIGLPGYESEVLYDDRYARGQIWAGA